MPVQPVERKLAAIFAADIAGLAPAAGLALLLGRGGVGHEDFRRHAKEGHRHVEQEGERSQIADRGRPQRHGPGDRDAQGHDDRGYAIPALGLEGGVDQRVGPAVPLGQAGFADDTAPADALVAVPRPPTSTTAGVDAAGREWVVADTLVEARARAGSVPGRRTTRADVAPLALPDRLAGGVRLATSWVEPAYLEPDASWCEPGGSPASPLANGGAFGAKLTSAAPAAARALADGLGRTVRVVYSREDVVRLGPKRPPIAATAVVRDGELSIEGRVVGLSAGWAPRPRARCGPSRWPNGPCCEKGR